MTDEELQDCEASVLLAEVRRLREKNSELNRRCQTYESGLREKLREHGPSLGRLLACAGYAAATNKLEDLRSRLTALAESWDRSDNYSRGTHAIIVRECARELREELGGEGRR